MRCLLWQKPGIQSHIVALNWMTHWENLISTNTELLLVLDQFSLGAFGEPAPVSTGFKEEQNWEESKRVYEFCCFGLILIFDHFGTVLDFKFFFFISCWIEKKIAFKRQKFQFSKYDSLCSTSVVCIYFCLLKSCVSPQSVCVSEFILGCCFTAVLLRIAWWNCLLKIKLCCLPHEVFATQPFHLLDLWLL